MEVQFRTHEEYQLLFDWAQDNLIDVKQLTKEQLDDFKSTDEYKQLIGYLEITRKIYSRK